MGIFSSKYKHYVNTVVQRVVEEENIVDPFLLAIAESTFKKVDLVDNVLETALNSMPVRSNNLYNFVKNNYPEKLPSVEVVLDTRFADAAEAVITSLNPSISPGFIYTKFGPPNAYHEAWEILSGTYYMDTTTSELVSFATPGVECFVDSIRIDLPLVMKDQLLPWQLENWVYQEPVSTIGYSPVFGQVIRTFTSKPVSFRNIASPLVTVFYKKKQYPPEPVSPDPEWVSEAPTITDMTFTFPLTRIGSGEQFYHSLYVVGGIKNFWTYEYKSGGYSSLDNILEQSVEQQKMGQFYPNIYYRLNKNEEVDPVYKKMAKKLDMDFEDISTTINENPDITDVDSAIFNMGIPADSTNELELRYVFDFFKKVWLKNRTGAWSPNDWVGVLDTRPQSELFRDKNAIYIQDDVFKSALVYERIARKLHAGTIGPVGFADTSTGVEVRQREETNIEDEPIVVNYDLPYRRYRKQVSLSFYEEIVVYQLSMVYTIFEQYETNLGDEDEEICLVPLDRSIVRTYNIREQQELLTRSFNFVFNSHVIQKVKWYQTGVFKVLMVIAAVFIFVYTGAGAELLAQATVAAGGGIVAFSLFILEQVLTVVLTQLAFKVFVKIVGPELAFLVALVSMTMGMMKQNFSTLSANDLLKLAMGAFDGIGAYFQDAIEDLQTDLENFLSLKTDQEKELERAENLLTTKVHPIAPIILGETPTDFLYRTTVFSTSGLTRINDVGSYTERSLQLPTTGSSFDFM